MDVFGRCLVGPSSGRVHNASSSHERSQHILDTVNFLLRSRASCRVDSGMGDESKVDRPTIRLEDLKEDLASCLEPTTDPRPRSAYFTSDAYCPNPALEVSGIGIVGLPLSERDAVALKNVAHPAVDNGNSSKTWQIDPSEFTIRSSYFRKWIEATVVRKVVGQLGVDDTTANASRADLRCLSISEPGGMLPLLKESSKHTGTYGRLIVTLPAEYTGGLATFKYNGRTQDTLDSTNCLTKCKYGAW